VYLETLLVGGSWAVVSSNAHGTITNSRDSGAADFADWERHFGGGGGGSE